MIYRIAFAVAFFIPVVATASADKSCTDYPQLRGFFPFGMYVAAERIGEWDKPDSPAHMGRPMIEPYRRDLEDMARHYINLVAVENTSAIPVPMLKEMLAEGERTGIFTWASENGLPNESEAESYAQRRISQFKDEQSLLVWSPWDEPYPENMEKWLKWKKAFEEADPNHPVISVTCGGPKGFENYSVVQASDYYPVYVENPDPWSVRPFVKRYTDASSRPNWFVVQAFRGEGRRMPTNAESRLMTYAALGEGAKGILYFIYDHLVTHYNYPESPQWEDIGQLGRFLRAVGPEILDTSVDRESKLVSMTCVPEHPEGSALPSAVCSVLSSPQGHAFVLVYNNDVLRSTQVTLSLQSQMSKLRFYDLNALVDGAVSRPAGTVSFTLRPGDGRVFLASSERTYSRIAGRVRLNLYRAERQILAVDRESASRWGVELSAIDKLAGRAEKAIALNDPKKAVTLIVEAREELENAKASDPRFSAARASLDEVYRRLWELDQALRAFREKYADRWEDKMKWPLDGAISRFLELEHRFGEGDRLVTERSGTLLSDVDRAIADMTVR